MKEGPPLTIRRNFSWTFLGNTIYAATQWGMLTVLAKLGSPQMVGQFALGFAVVVPINTFSNLALRQVQATDSRRAYQFGDYLALRLISLLIATLVIATIAFTAHYEAGTGMVILMIGLAKVFESISDVFYGLLQNHERMDRIAISMMIKGPLSLAALGIIVSLTHSVFWGVTGMAAAWAVVLFTYDIRSGLQMLGQGSPGWETLRPHWSAQTLRRLAWLSLPLGFAAMLNLLNVNIPRYFIAGYLGQHELGIYAALAYVLQAGATIVIALGQAVSPRLSRYYAHGDGTAFRMLMAKLLGFGLALGAISILVALIGGQKLLTVLYRREYAVHTNVFLWLIIGGAFSYLASFLNFGMTAARLFALQPVIFVVSCTITALSCFLLIRQHGLLAGAWALLISSIVQVIAMLLGNVYALQRLNRKAMLYDMEPV